VSIGTHASILPVTICDHVVIGAGAVVTKDITEPGIYVGNPARLLRPLPEERAAAACAQSPADNDQQPATPTQEKGTKNGETLSPQP
jgi:serine acetyltransferase